MDIKENNSNVIQILEPLLNSDPSLSNQTRMSIVPLYKKAFPVPERLFMIIVLLQ
tara:strand:+ start:655 stop:819 length:165 start_codon:yes stop_codon:yes gene_type:complete